MTKLWNNVLVLGAMAVGLGMSGLAHGATGTGPYYATPAWDQKLDCPTTANCPRFVVLTNWNNEAVLDRETGLVWEQSPSTTSANWQNALVHCLQLSKGGREGWRLPSIQELVSVIDRTQSNPALPSGHPFSNVYTDVGIFYWSTTTFGNIPSPPTAWIAWFGNGDRYGYNKTLYVAKAWCVRGGSGLDVQ